MISLICACNDRAMLGSMLQASLNRQTYRDFELIVVDAREHGFKGAAQTLNYGASLARGELLVFVHQDVELTDENFLQKLADYSRSNDFGIAGAAGVSERDKKVYSAVFQGPSREHAGAAVEEPTEVDALDECLFAVKRKNFSPFTDYGSWHFYAVEYSLRCKARGESVVVLPYEIYHLSPGWSLDKSYWATLKKVARDFKYRKSIPTTMGIFKNGVLLPLHILYKRLKNKFRRQEARDE